MGGNRNYCFVCSPDKAAGDWKWDRDADLSLMVPDSHPFEFSPLAYNSGFLTHSLEVLLAILNAKSPLLYLLLLVGGCRLCLPSYQSDAIVHDL